MTTHTTAEYTIDAAGKSLGRVASEAAKMLMGKTLPSYTANIRSNVRVNITNTSKLTIRERKLLQKTYTRYSGYPGGFKKETLGKLNTRKGHGEAVRRAIHRMLPDNTMRVARMKNLTITE
jgi:large subunit ribosomal protein L13